MQPPHLQCSNASKGIRGMPPAHQQQKRLLLPLKREAAIILIACTFWLLHLWSDRTAEQSVKWRNHFRVVRQRGVYGLISDRARTQNCRLAT